MKFANKVDEQYHALLQDILDNGDTVSTERTGVGTKAIFGKQLTFDMKEGLPCITTKKMYFKGIIGELLWFLGNHLNDPKYQNLPIDNTKYLLDNNINIWVGDCYKAYLNYINNPENTNEVEAHLNDWLIDDPVNYCVRSASEKEFIDLIKSDDKFAFKFGGIGAGYGWQWNQFGGNYDHYKKDFINKDYTFQDPNYYLSEGDYGGINQIKELINKLKTNPFDRRLIVNAWNPNDLGKTILPPCHYGFSCYVREITLEEQIQWVIKNLDLPMENVVITEVVFDEKNNVPKYALSLMWRQRSIDVLLGLPFNITSYAILLELLAKEVNMIPDKLIGSLENTHIYLNHIEAVQEQLSRDSIFALPTLNITSKSIFDMSIGDIKVEGYQSHTKIKADLNN